VVQLGRLVELDHVEILVYLDIVGLLEILAQLDQSEIQVVMAQLV
jgi:hypothetical protein